MELPVGDHYCRVDNINRADCNSVCVNYYQLGPATLHQDVIDDLMVVSIVWHTSRVGSLHQHIRHNVTILVLSCIAFKGFSSLFLCFLGCPCLHQWGSLWNTGSFSYIFPCFPVSILSGNVVILNWSIQALSNCTGASFVACIFMLEVTGAHSNQ